MRRFRHVFGGRAALPPVPEEVEGREDTPEQPAQDHIHPRAEKHERQKSSPDLASKRFKSEHTETPEVDAFRGQRQVDMARIATEALRQHSIANNNTRYVFSAYSY